MPKKKFSETKVGKFLKGAAPKLLNIIGDVFPSVGILSKAKDLIQKDTNISKEDKDIALKLLEIDVIEMQEVSKRWASDMASDSWLSKNTRPMTLIFLTVSIIFLILLDSLNIDFGVDSQWIDLLKSLLITVYVAYFGSRGVEKFKSMGK
tara:strand:+ start:1244 stop:1693 length:450 start_codon:yes stop_codon:yes gene_type:complete